MMPYSIEVIETISTYDLQFENNVSLNISIDLIIEEIKREAHRQKQTPN